MPATSAPPVRSAPVHRIEVWPKPAAGDPAGEHVVKRARSLGASVERAATAKVYLIQGSLSPLQLQAIQGKLLADPITESAFDRTRPAATGSQTVEIHPLPGVMDPAAQSVRESIRALTGVEVGVSTGRRVDLAGLSEPAARDLAVRILANPAVHAVHTSPYHPPDLPRGKPYELKLRHIELRNLSDEQLARLSRDAHLFLSIDEMRAIRAYYQSEGREPTDIELETLAQTWSEHCVHKTLKSRIRYRNEGTEARRHERIDPIDWHGRPGHTVEADGTVVIDNLLKSTVAAATFELMKEGADSWLLSVFKDNAGIIAFDEQHAVCVKVETHNHPSAIEPYGGSATGIGGCIRDVIGTGLAAKPIASTDVFCVAHPDHWKDGLPPNTLHPRRILTDIVAGVRDYGNRMGIPTVSGGVFFDDRYVGNPLVFCGCIGVMPRHLIRGKANAGDRIIALGGRTGRDGIHGATFSSTELEHTSADEFSHAVQIGNAIEEKRVLDAILRARDEGDSGPLFSAITDCGAGGFSSAVGEMGSELGAEVHLDRAPLKYDGLSYTEIWISEAQERMVLAVPSANLSKLRDICRDEGVELADLGHFGSPTREIVLHYHGEVVGRLGVEFLHDGIPMPTRDAAWGEQSAKLEAPRSRNGAPPSASTTSLRLSVSSSLPALLAHPTIASKHWIIRQYDHEVQGNTAVKPLVGPCGRGPGDAAVVEPAPGTDRGLAISQGLQNGVGDPRFESPGRVGSADPYLMALAAVDECVRNLVCVGADPDRIAILDNFCWPSCQKPDNLARLVRAAEGCYDAAKAYRTPFVSGKDSLNNQLRYTDPATGQERLVEIPPTLLITGIGIVPKLSRCVTMDAKQAGNLIVLVGATRRQLDGSVFHELAGEPARSAVATVDLRVGPATARAIHSLIMQNLVRSAHDCSEGGLLVAIAEMLIASGGTPTGGGKERAALALGIDMIASPVQILKGGGTDGDDPCVAAFSESPSRYLLEVAPDDFPRVERVVVEAARCAGVELPLTVVGTLTKSPRMRWAPAELDASVEELAASWLGTLDW